MALQHRTFIVSVFGFSLFILFNGMLLLNPALPSFFSTPEGGSDPAFNWATQIGYTATFFLLSVVAYFWVRKPFSIPFAATVCLYAMGFAILITAKNLFAGVVALSALSGLLLGAAGSCCFTSWVQVFKSLGRNQAQLAILLGSVLGIAPNILFFFMFPNVSMLVQVAIFLPLGLVLLFLCTRWASHALDPDDRPAAHPQKYWATFSDLGISFACIALLSLIAPIAGAAILDAQTDVSARVLISLLSNIGAAITLFICWRLIKVPVTFERLGLIIFPLYATAFILLVVLDTLYWPFFLFMGDMLFCLVSMLAIYTSIDISLDRKVNTVVVFGVIAGTMCLARLLGWLMGTMIDIIPAFSDYQLPVVAVALLYGFSILIYFVLRTRKSSIVKNDGQGDADQNDLNPDSVTLRCEKLAELYHLSMRELEILDLLAHGRDIPSAAKILFISENTVRTHTKRLYRSLDVHTRQELIDLLESSSDSL